MDLLGCPVEIAEKMDGVLHCLKTTHSSEQDH